MRVVVLLLMTWICADAPVAAETVSSEAPLHEHLSSGPHGIGFQRLWVLDPSRVWPRSEHLDSLAGVVARPIRIDVWYPAQCDEGTMTARDYVEIEPPAAAFAGMTELLGGWDRYSYEGLTEDGKYLDQLLDTRSPACLEATPAAGRFPLVVYSAGWFNRSPDNTVLAEHLASRGFVVAALPQLHQGLWTYSFQSDFRSVEHQIRDLEVAVGEAGKLPFVDRRRIAAMGYSTGGDVALLLAGRNPLIDAVVGLDASWSLPGAENDVDGSPFFGPELQRVPVLALRRPLETDESLPPERLTGLGGAPLVFADVPGSTHGHFSDDVIHRFRIGTGPAEAAVLHAKTARAVTLFLDKVLVDSETATEPLVAKLEELGLSAVYRAPTTTTPAEGED